MAKQLSKLADVKELAEFLFDNTGMDELVILLRRWDMFINLPEKKQLQVITCCGNFMVYYPRIDGFSGTESKIYYDTNKCAAEVLEFLKKFR